ncbi:PTS lactose/cellobiose transporter subunit IIA [Peribacillus sp. NPDC097895]|uniref:PTS lactose/cellobiose transporter subunit IIA n=1 Tax=Peribacillus sp. NPDC097895 TaxID=3390619 RepID=UPI003D0462FD
MSQNLSTEKVAFQLILHSGNARSLLMEGMRFARDNEFELAETKVSEAKYELNEAHHSQTSLIQNEALGTSVEFSILLVHAQDHLMTTITVKELTEEIIFLHKKIENS